MLPKIRLRSCADDRASLVQAILLLLACVVEVATQHQASFALPLDRDGTWLQNQTLSVESHFPTIIEWKVNTEAGFSELSASIQADDGTDLKEDVQVLFDICDNRVVLVVRPLKEQSACESPQINKNIEEEDSFNAASISTKHNGPLQCVILSVLGAGLQKTFSAGALLGITCLPFALSDSTSLNLTDSTLSVTLTVYVPSGMRFESITVKTPSAPLGIQVPTIVTQSAICTIEQDSCQTCCSLHGTCMASSGCVCMEGYEGDDCSSVQMREEFAFTVPGNKSETVLNLTLSPRTISSAETGQTSSSAIELNVNDVNSPVYGLQFSVPGDAFDAAEVDISVQVESAEETGIKNLPERTRATGVLYMRLTTTDQESMFAATGGTFERPTSLTLPSPMSGQGRHSLGEEVFRVYRIDEWSQSLEAMGCTTTPLTILSSSLGGFSVISVDREVIAPFVSSTAGTTVRRLAALGFDFASDVIDSAVPGAYNALALWCRWYFVARRSRTKDEIEPSISQRFSSEDIERIAWLLQVRVAEGPATHELVASASTSMESLVHALQVTQLPVLLWLTHARTVSQSDFQDGHPVGPLGAPRLVMAYAVEVEDAMAKIWVYDPVSPASAGPVVLRYNLAAARFELNGLFSEMHVVSSAAFAINDADLSYVMQMAESGFFLQDGSHVLMGLERLGPAEDRTGQEEMFECESGALLPRQLLCDGVEDCIDASDEGNCLRLCDDTLLNVTLLQWCDGYAHCKDMSDEKDCAVQATVPNLDHSWHLCTDGSTVIVQAVCDGIEQCPDASDEEPSLCRGLECDEGSLILHPFELCDGILDCVDRTDESSCPGSDDHFICADGSSLVRFEECDGKDDCRDGSDEDSHCETAPPSPTVPANPCNFTSGNKEDEDACLHSILLEARTLLTGSSDGLLVYGTIKVTEGKSMPLFVDVFLKSPSGIVPGRVRATLNRDNGVFSALLLNIGHGENRVSVFAYGRPTDSVLRRGPGGVASGYFVNTITASSVFPWVAEAALIRFTLEFSKAGADLDLHVVDPSGTHTFYGNSKTRLAGLDYDDTNGPGVENIDIPRSLANAATVKGEYLCRIHYFSAPSEADFDLATYTLTVSKLGQQIFRDSGSLAIADSNYDDNFFADHGSKSVIYRITLQPKLVITMADRATPVPTTYHYSLQLWSGWWNPVLYAESTIERVRNAGNNIIQRGNIELLREPNELFFSQFWEAWHRHSTEKCWSQETVALSRIFVDGEQERSENIMPVLIQTDDQDEEAFRQRWNDIVNSALKNYKWAEPPPAEATPKNFPHSIYQIGNFVTNSNTFIRWLLRTAGIRFSEMSMFHPGYDHPVDRNTNLWGSVWRTEAEERPPAPISGLGECS